MRPSTHRRSSPLLIDVIDVGKGFVLICLSVVVSATLGGCQSKRSMVLNDTDIMFQNGQYARALTDYQEAVRKGLDSEESERAWFNIGTCYTMMKQYSDAVDAYRKYLERYPNGRYRVEAGEALGKIERGLDSERAEQVARHREIEGAIQDAENKVQGDTKDAKAHYDLADLYWQAGRYVDSADSYGRAIGLNKDYLTDPVLVYRVRVTDSGRVVPKTGSLGADEFGNDGPLRVRSTDTRTIAGFDDWSDKRTVAVSGRVDNTSAKGYGPVTVEVNLYALRGELLGNASKSIGKIPGGESRDFVVELTVLGNVRNVGRTECRLTYDW